jgi:hypothetical protein
MPVPVGLNVWSRLVAATVPYFDRVVGPFDSLWLPDHAQYDGHDVADALRPDGTMLFAETVLPHLQET